MILIFGKMSRAEKDRVYFKILEKKDIVDILFVLRREWWKLKQTMVSCNMNLKCYDTALAPNCVHI